METLTEHKYIHAEGSWYVWDRTQAEYGYMVYIVSDILGVKHPANNTIMWKPFQALFLNASHIEGVAKASVSNNISQFSNYNAWCNEAKIFEEFYWNISLDIQILIAYIIV